MRSVSRRAILAGALPLAACGVDPGEDPTITLHVPLETQPRFFEAVRSFSEREGYTLTETNGLARNVFIMLQGWRSTIVLSQDFDQESLRTGRPQILPEQFRASIFSTMEPLPWALRGGALAALMQRFSDAVAVDGVTIVARGNRGLVPITVTFEPPEPKTFDRN